MWFSARHFLSYLALFSLISFSYFCHDFFYIFRCVLLYLEHFTAVVPNDSLHLDLEDIHNLESKKTFEVFDCC